MKKREVILIFAIVLILSFNFISASFDVGEPSDSLREFYGASENIKGWINISLDEESAGSEFTDGETSISLIELIELNEWEEEDYVCSPSDCENDYSASSPDSEKNFELDEEESVIVGIKFEGDNIGNIEDFSLDVTSDNSESEEIPLRIDILSDGEAEWQAYEGSGNFGSENSGCFHDFGETTLRPTSIYPQCEKIHLLPSAGVELGAYVDGEGDVEFEMIIKKYGTSNLKKCSAIVSGTGEKRISCIPDFSIKEEGDYFVCIKTKIEDDNGKYEIKSEQDNPCGFAGDYSNEYTIDFEIFARSEIYANIGSFTLDNDEAEESTGVTINIESRISNYLNQVYDKDCPEGCVVPIKIYFGAEQEIILSNFFLSYVSSQGYSEIEELHDVEETSARISTPEDEFKKLFLDKGNFLVPDGIGEYDFELYLGDDEVISKTVEVAKVPEIKNVLPRTTAAVYPTEFEVTVESEKEILSYKWDFGDEKTETTTSNKVIHTYEKLGEYELKITVVDSEQRSYENVFNITVGSSKEITEFLLQKSLTDLTNIKEQINKFALFSQNNLMEILDIDSIEQSIEDIQKVSASASTESDYNSILTELLKLKIPESVYVSASSELIDFYSNPDEINLNVLSAIGAGEYESNKYIESIIAWNQRNIDAQISFEEITAKYEYSEEVLLNVFDLDIEKKNQTSRVYLVIGQLEDINFKEDYSERSEGNYFYIELSEDEKISFSTTEDVSFIDLPVFIAPSINELSTEDIIGGKDKQLLKIAIFVLIIFFLIILGVVAYVILKEWYKKKYEGHLFKNRNDLYNLISYVQSSKKKNIKNREIASKLRKAGWKSEQVNYVIKKYAGKRIGMPEFPVGKISNLFKKKSEEQKPKYDSYH